MKEKSSDTLKLILKITISLIIIFFIVEYIKSNIATLKDFKFHINYYYLTASFTIVLFYIFNQFLLWHYITKQNGCNLGFCKSISSRAYSEFGKYIPGKVFGYAMLFYIYSKENKSKALLSFSIFFELLASTLAAALIFLLSVFITDISEFRHYRFVALILLLCFFIIIHPGILNYFSRLFFKIMKREPIKMNISYYQLLKIILLYSLNFFIFGFAFVLFTKSIYSVSFSDYMFITGATVGAGIIGLFAFFVPAGLGVREGVMVFMLSFLMPPAMAGIIALSSRIWLTFAEVFLFGIIYII